jgi:hypothetical protein
MSHEDPQASLITPAQAGAPYGHVPPLATCSYAGYRPGMGTPVRITRGTPPWVKLPSERYGGFASWPDGTILAPGDAIFHRNLPPAAFRAGYIAQLEEAGPQAIAGTLARLPVQDGRLCLLCFEGKGKITLDPWACHRRIFAQWWEDLTGTVVPELSGADVPVLFTTP